MRRTLASLLTLLTFLGSAGASLAIDFSRIPLANGFDIPVGQNGKSYYKARGMRPNGHLGEDWNGAGGGDTDLGDPICATADGLVVFCQDYRMGWGNVVILRHAYQENGEIRFVDSLYGHLLDFNVTLGQQVKRGQRIARMGNNRGMYEAHLHFEMRKNITVGMYRSSFPRDYSIYWDPTDFVARHRTLPGGSRLVSVPVNTFPATPPPLLAGTRLDTPAQSVARAGLSVVGNTLIAKAQNPALRMPPAGPGTPTRVLPPAASDPARRPTPENPRTAPRTAALPQPAPAPKTARIAKSAADAKSRKPASDSAQNLPAIATAPENEEPEPVAAPPPTRKQTPIRRPEFRVNRFEDMRALGYE